MDSVSTTSSIVWLLPKTVVTTAIELHDEQRIEVSPKLIATILVYPYFSGPEQERIAILNRFNEVFEGGLDGTRQQLRDRIERITTSVWDDERRGQGSGGGWSGNVPLSKSEIHRLLLAKQDFWEFAFELLANDNTSAAESLDVLKTFANTKIHGTEELMIPETLRPALEAAIKTWSPNCSCLRFSPHQWPGVTRSPSVDYTVRISITTFWRVRRCGVLL